MTMNVLELQKLPTAAEDNELLVSGFSGISAGCALTRIQNDGS